MRVALVTPLSGPLARYGLAGAEAIAMWAEREGVELALHDAHPDPAAAVSRAEGDDVLLGPYGSGPMREVVRATDRLVWNHGGARAGGPRVVPLLAPARTYLGGSVDAACDADPAIATATVRHGDTGFGRAVGDGAEEAARARGLRVSRGDVAGEAPAADLLLVAGSFSAERSAADRLLPGRWRAASFVGAGVDEVLADLGARREGLLGPAQWVPSAAPEPEVGMTAAGFVEAYRRRTGEDPSYPAAQAYAAAVVAAHCVRRSDGGDDDAVLATARGADVTTLFGRFRLDPQTGEQLGHQVLTVQWQDGRRRVVRPLALAQAPVRPR